jgi:hypothetical protein
MSFIPFHDFYALPWISMHPRSSWTGSSKRRGLHKYSPVCMGGGVGVEAGISDATSVLHGVGR